MTDVYVLSTFAHYYAHCHETVEVLRDAGVEVEVVTTNKRAIWGEWVHPTKWDPRGLWMVAGSVDAMKLGDREYVYVEHGAGQTYDADTRGRRNASYSSGRLPGNVRLFLCPNETVAARRRRSHPDVPSVVVGTSKLDPYHAHMMGWHDGVEPRTVAFAWHWDCKLVPEAATAWEHYRPYLIKTVLALHRVGINVVSTAHPRIARRVRYHIERCGMEWWDEEDVLTRAAVLCWDNTSFGYEFASLERPTVILNAPWYRKDVHHGLRFWDCLPGEQVDEWWQIPDAVERALADIGPGRECVDAVYPVRDGKAAQRSAEAIMLRL